MSDGVAVVAVVDVVAGDVVVAVVPDRINCGGVVVSRLVIFRAAVALLVNT